VKSGKIQSVYKSEEDRNFFEFVGIKNNRIYLKDTLHCHFFKLPEGELWERKDCNGIDNMSFPSFDEKGASFIVALGKAAKSITSQDSEAKTRTGYHEQLNGTRFYYNPPIIAESIVYLTREENICPMVSISTTFNERLFRTKLFCTAFLLLVRLSIFWHKNTRAKAARKMLTKFTKAQSLCHAPMPRRLSSRGQSKDDFRSTK